MILSRVMYFVFVVYVIGTQGKPSLSFNFPAITPFGSKAYENNRSALKTYSGRRVRNDSIRMVYFYDQTVAVVELEPTKLLLNCELIEVYEPEQALKSLGELTDVSRPVGISLKEMLTLMDQCKQIEEMANNPSHNEQTKNLSNRNKIESRGILANNPFTLLSGIIPGTKWCGTGDIANDYHDLGAEANVDACCRAHDLCPVKIRAYSKRYNLTNQSLYTKSHCTCDDTLFNCLKDNESPTASIMGNIYFNLVQVPCLEDTSNGRKFRNAKSNF